MDLLNNTFKVGEGGWAGSVTITPSQYKTMKQALCWAEPAAMMKAQKVQGRAGWEAFSPFLSLSSTRQCPAPPMSPLLRMTHLFTYFGAQAP